MKLPYPNCELMAIRQREEPLATLGTAAEIVLQVEIGGLYSRVVLPISLVQLKELYDEGFGPDTPSPFELVLELVKYPEGHYGTAVMSRGR